MPNPNSSHFMPAAVLKGLAFQRSAAAGGPQALIASFGPGAAFAGKVRRTHPERLFDGAPKRLNEAFGKPLTVERLVVSGGVPGGANMGQGGFSTAAEDGFLMQAAACLGVPLQSVLHFACGMPLEFFAVGDALKAVGEAEASDHVRRAPEFLAFPFMFPEGEAVIGAGCLSSTDEAVWHPMSPKTFLASTDLFVDSSVLESLLPNLWLAGPAFWTGFEMPGDALLIAATGEASQPPVLSWSDPRIEALAAGLKTAVARAAACRLGQLSAKPEGEAADAAFGAASRRLSTGITLEAAAADSADEAERTLRAMAHRVRAWSAWWRRQSGKAPLGAMLETLRAQVWAALMLEAEIATLERSLIDIDFGPFGLFKGGQALRLPSAEDIAGALARESAGGIQWILQATLRRGAASAGTRLF